MENNEIEDFSNEGLAEAIAKFLSCTVVSQYMAHGYHWNVKGPEFTQFHKFFGDVYEDWSGVEDRLAEYIRILGFDAPFQLHQFLEMACLTAKPSAGNPLEMTANLYEANLVLLNCVTDIFNIASAINNQGIANFAAERMDAHSKWKWQLGTTIGADSMSVQNLDMGKFNAETPLAVVDIEDVAAELQPIYAAGPRKILYPEAIEFALIESVFTTNDELLDSTRKITVDQAKAVYRRGAFAATTDSSRSSQGMARVSAFLDLLNSEEPKNPEYVQDNDLLPKTHPRSHTGKQSPLTASAMADRQITIELKSADQYETPEVAIYAIAEFSGLGYDAIPSFRAAWRRGVSASESPFNRAAMLAIKLYDSRDADLLPKQEKDLDA